MVPGITSALLAARGTEHTIPSSWHKDAEPATLTETAESRTQIDNQVPHQHPSGGTVTAEVPSAHSGKEHSARGGF